MLPIDAASIAAAFVVAAKAIHHLISYQILCVTIKLHCFRSFVPFIHSLIHFMLNHNF